MMFACSREHRTWLRCGNAAWKSERLRDPSPSAVQASDNVKDFSGVDCALVAVKNYSLAEIAPAAAFLAAQGALIVPLLNGVEVVDQLVANGVPQAQLVGGLTAISVVRTAPGVFERRSPFQRVVLGELAQSQPERKQRIDAIVQAFREAGVDASVSADITADLWRKFAFIASMAAACGLVTYRDWPASRHKARPSLDRARRA